MSFTLESGDLFHNPDVKSFSNVGNLSVGSVVEDSHNLSNSKVDGDNSLLDGFSGFEFHFGDGNLSFLNDSDSVFNDFSFSSSFNILDGNSYLSFESNSVSCDDRFIVNDNLVEDDSNSGFGLEDEDVDDLGGFFFDSSDLVSHGLDDNNSDLSDMFSGLSLQSEDVSSDVDSDSSSSQFEDVVHLNNKDVDLLSGSDFNLSLGNSKSIDGPSLKFHDFNSNEGYHSLPEFKDLGCGIISKEVDGILKILSPDDGDLLDLGLVFDSNGGDDGEGALFDFLGDSDHSVSPGESVGVDSPKSICLDEFDLLSDEESVVCSDSGDDDHGLSLSEVLIFKDKCFGIFLGLNDKFESEVLDLLSIYKSESFDSSINLGSDCNGVNSDSLFTTSFQLGDDSEVVSLDLLLSVVDLNVGVSPEVLDLSSDVDGDGLLD